VTPNASESLSLEPTRPTICFSTSTIKEPDHVGGKGVITGTSNHAMHDDSESLQPSTTLSFSFTVSTRCGDRLSTVNGPATRALDLSPYGLS